MNHKIMMWIVISVIPHSERALMQRISNRLFILKSFPWPSLFLYMCLKQRIAWDEPEQKCSKKNPILFDQAELNDLIRNLNLSKDRSYLL